MTTTAEEDTPLTQNSDSTHSRTNKGWRVLMSTVERGQPEALLRTEHPIALVSLPHVTPAAMQTLIKVMYAAVTPNDVLRLKKKGGDITPTPPAAETQGRPKRWLPWGFRGKTRKTQEASARDGNGLHKSYLGGMDGAGEVVEVGCGVTDIVPGDFVQFHVCSPTRDEILEKSQELNENKRGEGGSWSTCLLVDRANVLPLSLPSKEANYSHAPETKLAALAEAAAMPYAAWSAYVALFDKLRVQEEETVLLFDDGIVGFIAAQICSYFRVRVVLVSSDPSVGICHSSSSSPAEARTNYLRQNGVHVIFIGDIFLQRQEEDTDHCHPELPLFDHLLICAVPQHEAEDGEKRMVEVFHKHLRVGAQVCFATSCPPSASLITALQHRDHRHSPKGEPQRDAEDTAWHSLIYANRQGYSIHFVHPYGFTDKDSMAQPLLSQIGEAVYQLYRDGAFRLWPEGCPPPRVFKLENLPSAITLQVRQTSHSLRIDSAISPNCGTTLDFVLLDVEG